MDSGQQRIIELEAPAALVLAGPGCGKTHILARRVLHASVMRGIPYGRMLCLTFTNRAAREMVGRIENYIGSVPGELFVGNLHRFCLQFLFANRLVHPDTAVLDDEDAEILAGENFDSFVRNIEHVQKVAAMLYQREHRHPESIIRTSKRHVSSNDIIDAGIYRRFKEENRLIDFDDILMMTYTAIRDASPGTLKMTDYEWIQIDEVQDLSPLQLAIVEILAAKKSEILYLGDEQQAIFGFTGAGIEALEGVRRKCAGNIHHLTRNYRSHKQLVELCNDYAVRFLDISPELLPESVNGPGPSDCLRLMQAPANMLTELMCPLARSLSGRNGSDSTAVLVRSNLEGRKVSEALESHGIRHILLTQHDLFRGADFKTLWSHLAVCERPERHSEWARLIYQCRGTRTLSEARQLTGRMNRMAICPKTLLDMDSPTDIENAATILNDISATVCVIDTETTGLNVDEDDIVQISAVKMCGGSIIPDSEFNVYIRSDRPVPAMLGDVENPLADLLGRVDAVEPSAGLMMFAQYIDGCIPAGHNLGFDIAILRNNISRHTTLPTPECLADGNSGIDTLRLSRLLYPNLWSHSLGFMTGYLGLKGVNSHLADDDVAATAELLSALAPTIVDHSASHRNFRAEERTRRIAARFEARYGELYRNTLTIMDSPEDEDDRCSALARAFDRAYMHFLVQGAVKAIPHFGYVIDLIDKIIVDRGNEHTLRAQASAHLNEILGFNEGDLFAQGVVRERLIVLTVHKAKGMEMDNVVIHNASSGFGSEEESMRILYVAMSRARQRLVVCCSTDPTRRLGELVQRFEPISSQDQTIMRMQEYRHTH